MIFSIYFTELKATIAICMDLMSPGLC